jgi:hypothetical protein
MGVLRNVAFIEAALGSGGQLVNIECVSVYSELNY